MRLSFRTQLILIYLASALTLSYFQFLTPFLPEVDSHFHITYSDLMKKWGLFRDGFPWTQFSLWKDQFTDSSLLFHIYLIPFTYFSDLAFGAKLATVLLGGAVYTSFFAVARLNGCRFAGWAWAALLFAGGELFFWRMNVPRPQLLSATLMLWTLHFLINGRLRPFVFLCFLYPLSYVAGFLPSFFALCLWAHAKLEGEELSWKFPAYGFTACALSYVINPYFPNNLITFVVVNFYVMWLAFSGAVQLHLAKEIGPIETRLMLLTSLPVIFGYISVFYVALKTGKKLSTRTFRLGIPTLAFVLMTFLSMRLMEYSIPLSYLWIGLALTEIGGAKLFRLPERVETRLKAAVLALVCLTAAGRALPKIHEALSAVKESGLKEAALYIKEVAEPYENVFTCDWDDGPALFYYNQEQRYLVMMDPTLMYYWSDKHYHAWRNATEAAVPPEEMRTIIREIFHARYGVCTKKFKPFYDAIKNSPHFKMVLKTDGGFVFEIL